MNLNQVTLTVSEIKRAIKFYQEVGFSLIVQSDHYARFECPEGEATFSLHVSEKAPIENTAVIYFEHKELDNWVAALKAKGFCFITEPKDEPWGWREARLSDPDGNKLCLYWAGENRKNPPWRLTD